MGSLKYADKTDKYAPKALTLSWTANSGAQGYSVELDKDINFSSPKKFTSVENKIRIEDLFGGTHYYYRIIAEYQDYTVKSKIFDFTTESLPRTVYIEGASNTRDIGGCVTESGKKIKQGMVYRGANLSDVTEAGKNKALNSLGIKTEIDLRRAGEGGAGGGSPLGDGVKYVNLLTGYYQGLFDMKNTDDLQQLENLRNVIRLFADQSNYPIYFHCQIGRDRTGTLAMILLGLLGENLEDISRDYEISFLSSAGTGDGVLADFMIPNCFNPTLEIMRGYGSDSAEFSSCVKNFVKSIGVTEAEISAIKNILLEN